MLFWRCLGFSLILLRRVLLESRMPLSKFWVGGLPRPLNDIYICPTVMLGIYMPECLVNSVVPVSDAGLVLVFTLGDTAVVTSFR